MGKIWQRIYKDLMYYKGAILVAGAYYMVVNAILGAFCPMILATGLPCPGCGMTRSFLCIVQGEWAKAYHLQPASFLFVLFGVYMVIMRYVLGKKILGAKVIIIVLFTILIGIYLYRMGMTFPSYAPMTYRRNNMLAKLYPEYQYVLQKIVEYVTLFRK